MEIYTKENGIMINLKEIIYYNNGDIYEGGQIMIKLKDMEFILNIVNDMKDNGKMIYFKIKNN